MALPELPEPREPHLRIGHSEREAVVDHLSGALADGRLDIVEYDERVRQVYVAKTHAELAPITADLPAPPPPPPPAPPKPGLIERLDLSPAVSGWLAMSVLLSALWLLGFLRGGGDTQGFWPIYPIGIYGAVILAQRIHRR
jgi:hypothetical protein